MKYHRRKIQIKELFFKVVSNWWCRLLCTKGVRENNMVVNHAKRMCC